MTIEFEVLVRKRFCSDDALYPCITAKVFVIVVINKLKVRYNFGKTSFDISLEAAVLVMHIRPAIDAELNKYLVQR